MLWYAGIKAFSRDSCFDRSMRGGTESSVHNMSLGHSTRAKNPFDGVSVNKGGEGLETIEKCLLV